MKTKTGSSRLALLAIAITAAWLTQPAYGVPSDQIVFTENSSTSLSATFNRSTTGVTVFNTGPNFWEVSFTGVAATGVVSWFEPENASLSNFVGGSGSNTLDIGSENSVFSPVNANGSNVSFGTNAADGHALFVTFNDNGDVVAAPDSGTTFSLFGFSLMGLAFLRRKLC
jgi:VPDSG-CTERM motif